MGDVAASDLFDAEVIDRSALADILANDPTDAA
jgi:hypothetical protein